MYIVYERLEMDPCCDYIRFFTGSSDIFEESTQVLELTGNHTLGNSSDGISWSNVYLSVHPNVWLQFSTDGSVTHRGFLVIVQFLFGIGEEQVIMTHFSFHHHMSNNEAGHRLVSHIWSVSF